MLVLEQLMLQGQGAGGKRSARDESMPYDETLAARVRTVLGERPDVVEKGMFGGRAFLLRGKMFCGVVGDELMLRVGPMRYQELLQNPNVRPMDFTRRPLPGFVFVAGAACRTEPAVRGWIEVALAFVSTLSAKRTTGDGGSVEE